MVSAHESITPPPPPPIRALADSGESPSPSYSFNPSLLIIAAIIAFVCVASASIHLLLRFLSRPSSSSSSQPPIIHRNPSAASSPSDHDRKALLDSLPLFSLASSLAALPKSSLDCAVCLSKFEPDDQLRLLPSCRHAFHSPCIDTWIQSTPSCPLCRSTIQIPAPPPPPPEPPSFRIEIGNVSSRRDLAPPHVRPYSLGSSFEYRVEDDVEAVLATLRRMPAVENPAPIGPPPPGTEVADSVGSKAWLKEYVDRLMSSASSSFSSLRFSSRRFDGVGADAGGGSWDSDGDGNDDGSRRSSGSYNYKWPSGAVS